jgi:hypothetical protein
VAVVIGAAWIALVWLNRPVLGIDTLPLMRGTEALDGCLGALDLVDCRSEGAIGPFPALQHIPDLVAYSVLGLSDGGRVRVLAFLSGLAIAASVWAAWVVFRRAGCPEWRWLFLVAVVSGPVIAYGNTTWGEMPAAGLLTLLVAAAFLQVQPALVGLAAFGAGLTKETAYPFVVALGLLALVLARRRTGRSVRLHVLGGAIGVASAIAVATALNLIRFGDATNTHYLNDEFRTPANRVLELAAGLVVSPSGGILFFWPIASVLVGLVLALPIARAARGAASISGIWPALGLVALLAALILGFASWWVPFGWAAWGPRLSLPWVLPILLLSLAAYGTLLRPLAARAFGSTPGLAIVGLATLVVASPHVGFLWRYSTVPAFFERETAHCPALGPGTQHYTCLHEQMWSRRPIWVDALEGLSSTRAILTFVAVAAVALGSLILFRRELRATPSPAAPDATMPSRRSRSSYSPKVTR